MKRRRKRGGFTLVEIMIVVLIIGILLTIAIPNFVFARQASRAEAIIASLKKIDAAKDQCAMDRGLVPGDDCADTAMATYLESYPPKFPVTGSFVKGTIGVEPTFNGRTAEGWESDKSGL